MDSGRTREGTCMFHYECQSRKGSIIEACIDGFLFGVCCDTGEDGEKGEDDNEVTGGDSDNVQAEGHRNPDPVQAIESIVQSLQNGSASQ